MWTKWGARMAGKLKSFCTFWVAECAWWRLFWARKVGLHHFLTKLHTELRVHTKDQHVRQRLSRCTSDSYFFSICDGTFSRLNWYCALDTTSQTPIMQNNLERNRRASLLFNFNIKVKMKRCRNSRFYSTHFTYSPVSLIHLRQVRNVFTVLFLLLYGLPAAMVYRHTFCLHTRRMNACNQA